MNDDDDNFKISILYRLRAISFSSSYEWFISLINFYPILSISNLHWNLINMHHSFSSLKNFYFSYMCESGYILYVLCNNKKKNQELRDALCRTMMHVKFHTKLCSLLKYVAIMLFSYNMSYLHRTNVWYVCYIKICSFFYFLYDVHQTHSSLIHGGFHSRFIQIKYFSLFFN